MLNKKKRTVSQIFKQNAVINKFIDLVNFLPDFEIFDTFECHIQDDPKLGKKIDDGSSTNDPIYI
mgnify:CR=1 FL=1